MRMRMLTASERREFLAYQGKSYVGVHAMTKKILHWAYCANCGLLALKNDVSRRALRQPCVWED